MVLLFLSHSSRKIVDKILMLYRRIFLLRHPFGATWANSIKKIFLVYVSWCVKKIGLLILHVFENLSNHLLVLLGWRPCDRLGRFLKLAIDCQISQMLMHYQCDPFFSPNGWAGDPNVDLSFYYCYISMIVLWVMKHHIIFAICLSSNSHVFFLISKVMVSKS